MVASPFECSVSGFLSPLKWSAHKKAKPLGSLHHLVDLLSSLMHRFCTLCTQAPSATKVHSDTGAAILRATFKLFQAITSSQVLAALMTHLAPRLAELVGGTLKPTGASKAIFSTELTNRIQAFWSDVAKTLQTRYTGVRDSVFLRQVAPVLCVTFLHPRKPIRTATVSLWSALFSSATRLEYPDELRSVSAHSGQTVRTWVLQCKLSSVIVNSSRSVETQVNQCELQVNQCELCSVSVISGQSLQTQVS